MDTTRRIADFVAEVTYSQIPADTIEAAKESILDCIGVTLAGSKEPCSRILAEFAKQMGGESLATIIGWRLKTSPLLAALANGTTGHALDYDDTAPAFLYHPTVVLLPAILALAEANEASGQQVMEAYLTGFEVQAKLLAGLGHAGYLRGWHNTSTVGTMGATVAAAKMLRLTGEQTAIALGIAASEAGGLRQNFGTMTKPLHAGIACRNGVMSAILAGKGFTASENILEVPAGYGTMFGSGEECDFEMMTADLGNPFAYPPDVVRLKPYPSCGGTHRCLDAALYLKKEYAISAEDVAEVKCRTSDVIPNICIHHQPRTDLEAKFSVEYCVAVALLDGKAGLAQFTDERVKDPKLQELITKVKYVHPEEMKGAVGLSNSGTGGSENILPEAVTVKLKDGRQFFKEVPIARGCPGNPMKTDDLLAKYRACAGSVLSATDIERSIEQIFTLEKLPNINGLMKVISG
ncbi:MmgE/PrpD family protein [Chloroflexota bacterium]